MLDAWSLRQQGLPIPDPVSRQIAGVTGVTGAEDSERGMAPEESRFRASCVWSIRCSHFIATLLGFVTPESRSVTQQHFLAYGDFAVLVAYDPREP